MTQKELPNGHGKPDDRIADAADDLHSAGDTGIAGDLDDVGSDEGIPPWTDAGVSEEAQEAEQRTEKAVLRLAENRLSADEAIEAARGERDLVKRAKALVALEAISYPEKKPVRTGDMMVMQAISSDVNRWAAFDALFGDGEERPHLDTFSGRLVDHEGAIVDDRYPIVELVRALTSCGLSSQNADTVRKAYRDWGIQSQRNDLIRHVEAKIPQWDGKQRMDSKLIDLFKPFDTALNRRFGRYFWLSIYGRIFYPGCVASMVLSLFGAQKAGKSYFAKRICQVLTGNIDADSVQLNLDGDKLEFLREITGTSIIANIGEMTGFTRGDLNKIKAFITKTADNLHYKYEGNFSQNRQWVVIMDGNKYEGLQRDDTGNRRFYPMFVGQLPDKDKQPHWREKYSADFTGFEDDLWQIMAEARAWFEANGGLKGYERYESDVSDEVQEFSRNELRNDRGTIRDDEMDMFLLPILRTLTPGVINGTKRSGVWVTSGDIALAYMNRTKHKINPKHLATKMNALGAEGPMNAGKPLAKGYLFSGCKTVEDWREMLMAGDEDEKVSGGQSEMDKGSSGDGF